VKRWKIAAGADIFSVGDIVTRADGTFGTVVRRTVGGDAFHYVAETIEEFVPPPSPPEPPPAIFVPEPPPPPPPTLWQRFVRWLIGLLEDIS
jgi:hypothetical protein